MQQGRENGTEWVLDLPHDGFAVAVEICISLFSLISVPEPPANPSGSDSESNPVAYLRSLVEK